ASAARQGCTTVQAIGKTLQAGTNCGSCKSEISQIIAENAPLMTEQNLENEPA
ncbi:MAG: (2Fe-2S)-binding protein, partial [Parasphingorhabdus sp.]